MSESAIPTQMQWKFKELRNFLKETVKMTPSTGQTTMLPGNRIIVDLPYNSLCDWSTFTMSYTGQTNHAGGVVTGPAEYTRTRFFPRNTASIIQNLELKINGVSRFNVPDYNFVYNILYDYTQGGDALKRRQTGGENADPSNKHYIVGNDIIERRGYSIAPLNAIAGGGVPAVLVGNDDLARDRQRYQIRSWIGPLGGHCSTNIIDGNLLGIVSVEITLAPSSCLMLGVPTIVGGVTAGNNTAARNEVGRGPIGVDILQLGAGLSVAGENINYSLDNVEFSIVRYHMPAEWYAAEASVLSSGHTYKLFYPNYSVITGNATPCVNKAGTHRFSISTKSLDYVIGTFRLPTYDTPDLPLITKAASQASLEVGLSVATAENQIAAGCKRVFNQSRYFAHNGDSITQCRWKCGFTEFPPQTLDEQFNTLLQHFNCHQDTVSGMYPGINSIGAFRECFYSHILSLNVPGENEMYTVSGIDTNETPCVIEWRVESSPYTPSDITPAGLNCTPYLIAAYNSHLEIKAGRVVSTIS
jgi:hypothetical protein